MKNIFLFITLYFLNTQAHSQERIEGAYGGGDIRIRARNGLIFESQLRNFDFSNTGFTKVALLYWPDNQIGQHKIGVTIFENKTKLQDVSNKFNSFARSTTKAKFDLLTNIDFDYIDLQPSVLEQYFKRRQIGPGLKIYEEGRNFLKKLQSKGYDGIFLLYEHDLQDLFTGSNTWLPSKGIFKFYKKELVYHGLYSILIDLENQKKVQNIGYQQISGDYFYGDDPMSIADINLILEDIEMQFENNIEQIIEVHKLF
jgi:hypothetical protein